MTVKYITFVELKKILCFRKKECKCPFFTGCPVHPSTKNTIRWFFKHQPIEEIEDFDYRLLVGGRILEVNITSIRFAGQYGCRTLASVKALSVWVNVKKEGLLNIPWQHSYACISSMF